MRKLLIHPYKMIDASKGTPHCQEMLCSAELLNASLAPAQLWQESEWAVQCYLSQFDEVIVNVFAQQTENSILKALLNLPACTLLINDPAFAFYSGLAINKVLFCGDPAMFAECTAIASGRAGKEAITCTAIKHFPLFAQQWSMLKLPQAFGKPKAIVYAGFARTEHRHKQLELLMSSDVPSIFIGYDKRCNGSNVQHLSRLTTAQCYEECIKAGAVAIVGDEEYYTLGHFSHRLHQAYALNCIAFVHASLASCYLPAELITLLSFSAAEELESKWAYVQNNYSYIRAMQKRWQKQCLAESLSLCKDL